MNRAILPDGQPLSLGFERPDLPRFSDLPEELNHAYGGPIGFPATCLLANFVTSIDGIVALPDERESGGLISGGSAPDRFVMGLLRTCADTLLVGAGTFRKAGHDRFDAEGIYPNAAATFTEARRRLGLAPRPRLAVVTISGALDVSSPALEGGLIITTDSGATALRPRVSASTTVLSVKTPLGAQEVVAALRAEGARTVLTEGGPSLFAQLMQARLIDELFVTVAPRLFGRFPNDARKSLADGLDLAGAALELASSRHHGSFTFARYRRSG